MDKSIVMYSFFDSRCMDTVCFVCLLFVTCVMFHLRICFSVLFASISQVIGCEDCLRNDLDCVGSVLNSTYNFEFIALLYMYKARQRRRSRICVRLSVQLSIQNPPLLCQIS